MGNQVGGSVIVARCLKKEGVRTVFTLSGGHTMSIYYACADEGIEVIDCRSEADAVMAADAYAKVTGTLGVVITTAGPGTSNTYTGMLESMIGHTPVVQIGGSCPLYLQGTGDMQDVDNVSLMKHCTKWANRVSYTDRIAEYLDMAFRHAKSGIQGPTFLEIPVDILMGVTDADTVQVTAKSRTLALPYGEPAYIRAAAELLAAAERPLIVVGNSARYSAEPADAVRALAEYLDVPLIATPIGKGLFLDEDHRLARAGKAAAAEADVVLALCTANDLPLGRLRAPTFRADMSLIMVAPDSSGIGYNKEATVGIVAGAAPAASQILAAVQSITPPKQRTAWIETLLATAEAARAAEEVAIMAESEQVRAGRCATEVCRFLGTDARDWTVVADGGDAGCWINKLMVAHRPAQMLGLIANGSLGLAPGASIGAWYGNGKPILLYTGDGSFGYNFMEFSSLVFRKIPVVIVVSNDSAWGMVKGYEWIIRENVYKHYEAGHHDNIATNLPFIHFEKLAEVLGGYGELVERGEDIVPALQRAAASGLPAIVNVRVEDISKGGYSTRTEVTARSFGQFAFDFT